MQSGFFVNYLFLLLIIYFWLHDATHSVSQVPTLGTWLPDATVSQVPTLGTWLPDATVSQVPTLGLGKQRNLCGLGHNERRWATLGWSVRLKL